MNKVFYVIIMIIISLGSVGCSKEIKYKDIQERLYVSFETASGTNPIDNIPVTSNESKGTFERKYYDYSGANLNYLTIDGERYLDLSCNSIFGHKTYSMTYTLKCKYLFGDYETYTMTADFKEIPGKDNELVCVRFTFEGVEYPVSPDGCVTVPLDIP